MSAGEESSGEKVFDPTPQRLEEARKKGDIAKSNDVSAAAAYLGLLLAVAMGGALALDGAGSGLMALVAHPDRLTDQILGPGGPGLSARLFGEIALALSPLFLLPAAAVLVSLFAQRAIVVSGDKIKPKGSRLSPVENAKQKFGPQGLMEFAKALTKLVAIGIALGIYLGRDLDRMVGSARAEPAAVSALMTDSLLVMLVVTTIIAGTIAAVDLLWQQFAHRKKLRMSFQEMKEESKQSEGDPHMKGKRRARAQEIATNRMMLDVPSADVVIVNPTHYAVALKWSRARGAAPVCVAKGEDAVALRIREAAVKAGVPIHSDPPTARALHAAVEIGREIHVEHYRAVAAAIRFADRMRKAARERGRT